MILVAVMILGAPVIYLWFWGWLLWDTLKVYGFGRAAFCFVGVLTMHTLGAVLFAPYVT